MQARRGSRAPIATGVTCALVIAVVMAVAVSRPGTAGAATSAEPFGTVERASVSDTGAEANARSLLRVQFSAFNRRDTGFRALSADGRYVVFTSLASNLTGSSASGAHVYRRDRITGTTVAVTSGDRGGESASVSDDGSIVAFESSAPAWSDPDCAGPYRVFVADTASGSVTQVTPTTNRSDPDQVPNCPGGGSRANISGDGSAVAFVSGFDYPADDWLDGPGGVWVYDLGSGGYERIDVPEPPTAKVSKPNADPLSDVLHPRVSRDGSRVLFLSRLDAMHPDVPDGDLMYAYVRDRTAGTTLVASRNSAGQPVPVLGAALSDDGQHVAFATTATDAGQGDPINQADVFVRDLGAGTTRLVSVRAGGGSFGGGALDPAVNRDGTVVAFRGIETTNDVEATWVRDLALGETYAASMNTTGGLSETGPPSISADGNTVAFQSTATLLVENDTNGQEDVFVSGRQPCEPSGSTSASASRSQLADPPTCPLPEVVVTAIEVNQGIQNLDNDVPLIEGRLTEVRVHVRSTSDTIADVSARLRVRRASDQQFLADLQPRNKRGGKPPGYIDVAERPLRSKFDHAFSFLLGPALTGQAGGFTLKAQITTHPYRCEDPGANCFHEAVTTPGPVADVQLIGLSWFDSGGTYTAGHQDALEVIKQLYGALPVADLRQRIVAAPPWFTEYTGNPGAGLPLTAAKRMQFIALQVNAHRFFGCADGLSDRCVGIYILVEPTVEATVRGMTIGHDAFVAYMSRSTTRGLEAAHEFGHVLDRPHTQCLDEPGPLGFYPYPNGRLGSVDGDETDDEDFFGTDLLQYDRSRVLPAVEYRDVMSYCEPQWTSDFTWAAMRRALEERFGTTSRAPSAAQPRRAAAALSADLDRWLVSGAVDADGGQLLAVEAWPSSDPAPPGASSAHLVIRDATGDELARHPVLLEPAADGQAQAAAFAVSVPRPAGAARLELERDGTLLDAVAASPAAPDTPVISSPTGSERWGGSTPQTVAWAANDDDGDQVTASVWFQPASGAAWRPIALGVTSPSLEVDPRGLGAASAGRFRVVVSDGFHHTSTDSAPIVIEDAPPTIVASVAGEPTAIPGEHVTLLAFGGDPEDGSLEQLSVTWSSDLDGALGSGGALTIDATTLRTGRHRITAVARDSAGNRADATVDLDVVAASAAVPRLSGTTRIETGVAVSRSSYGGAHSASAAVLARADLFADALAGTPLAVRVDGPLLLTSKDVLSDVAADELQRVLPAGATVYLLGGEAALSPQVADAVGALGFAVRRLGGQDRYETAVTIARELPDPSVILLATGRNFPDALAAGTAAGARGGAVVLTADEATPPATAAYLDEHPGVPRYAIGGPAARGQPDATPLVGDDRYATANLVAATLLPDTVTLGVASGSNFPDALSGGAHLARVGGALLLSRPDGVPASVDAVLTSRAGRVVVAYLYGGPVALAQVVADRTRAALTPAS